MFAEHFYADEAGIPQIGGARILLVDDEPRLCDSIRQLFELRGYDGHMCTSGTEAIATLKLETFDLILLDLMLPDMTGHDVLDQIIAMGIRTPVIVVSGDDTIDAAISALRKGVYNFIRKPYEPEELLNTAENAIYKYRLEHANRVIQGKLEHSRNIYKYLVDSSPDLIYTLDGAGLFNFVNQRFEDVLGFTKNELIGRHYASIVHEDDIERAKYIFNERRTDSRSRQNVEFRMKCKGDLIQQGFKSFDNSFVTIVLKARGLYGEEGVGNSFLGTYGVARDISDRKKTEQVINHQAYHDALTDLPNRLLFKDRLGLAISQAERHGEKFAVMFVDLDRFKLVNDTLGHMHGDELLQMVASRLKGCLRKGDTLARMGGDEFTLLLPEVKNRDDAVSTADKILRSLVGSFRLGQREVFISASIGVSLYPEHGDSIDMLIKAADIAMYHVKWEGKNSYMFYNQDMNAVFHRKLSMENDLRRALDGSQFVLRYQPQIHLPSQSIIGMEVLIRWVHPELGLVSPSEFIPLAEETGLITKITDWIFPEACRQFSLWKEMGYGDIRMSVNFSPHDIECEDFVKKIVEGLHKHGLSNDILDVEITESTLLRDLENSVSKLRELRACGVKIAVDDFGTGYSSLSYLKNFPINTIKIDKSFIHDIKSSATDDVPLVSAMVAIANGFKLNVIAEGVETAEQLNVIAALGCTVMQGFLFSHPLDAEQATEALLNQHKLFQHTELNFPLNI